jgi:hypothetical protein
MTGHRFRAVAVAIVAVSSVAACSASTPTDLTGSNPLFSAPPTASTAPSEVASAPPTPAPLTGLPGMAGGTAVAVPIEIGDGAPVPVGLADADMVSVEFGEQGSIHLVGIFQSKYPERVGPLAAARPSDLKLLNTLDPLIVQYGATSGVLDTAKSVHVAVRTAGGSSGFSSAGSRYYANVATLHSAIKTTPTPFFEYADAGQALSRVDVGTVTKLVVSAPGHAPMTWTYDDAAHLWQSTVGGVRVATTNLVIMTMAYTTKHVSSLGRDLSFADPLGDGKAVVVSNDSMVAASWHKKSFDYALNLLGPDQDTPELAPGSTWILLAPTGSKVATS